MDKSDQTWVVYDAGPRQVRSPIVCLPPVCGTADVFFRQLLDLSAVGYRIISVSNVELYITSAYYQKYYQKKGRKTAIFIVFTTMHVCT